MGEAQDRQRQTMKRAALKRMGKNKARETAKYWPLRRKFLKDHPFCEFPLIRDGKRFTPGCTNQTVSIHHKKGQHWKIMNDTQHWMGLCSEHHRFVEDNKKWAREKGLILYQ